MLCSALLLLLLLLLQIMQMLIMFFFLLEPRGQILTKERRLGTSLPAAGGGRGKPPKNRCVDTMIAVRLTNEREREREREIQREKECESEQ